jgi:adenosine deaminase
METETIDKLFLELSQVTKAKTERELALEKSLKRQLESHDSIAMVLRGPPSDHGLAKCIEQCDDFVAEAKRALGIDDLRGSDPDDPDIYGQ